MLYDDFLLKCENLNISYNDDRSTIKVLNDINFILKKNFILGIVGESGCGKSTVAKAITGILPENAVVSGRILFDKFDLLNCTKKDRDIIRGNEISMVFQEPSIALNPARKIKHQFFDILGKKDLNEVKKRLSEVQLKNVENVVEMYPYQLSGGMKQRSVIAMAISKYPKILIADEPTSALDSEIRKKIVKLLVDLKNVYNMSLIYISHNISEVEKICNDILIMKNGNLIEYGSTAEIMNNPKEEYTVSLIKASKRD